MINVDRWREEGNAITDGQTCRSITEMRSIDIDLDHSMKDQSISISIKKIEKID